MTTPNGWPASSRSIRPGTPAHAREARPDRRRVEPEDLAEGDDRQRVVDVEPAGEPEVERSPHRDGAVERDPEAVRASSSTRVARTSAAGSVP